MRNFDRVVSLYGSGHILRFCEPKQVQPNHIARTNLQTNTHIATDIANVWVPRATTGTTEIIKVVVASQYVNWSRDQNPQVRLSQMWDVVTLQASHSESISKIKVLNNYQAPCDSEVATQRQRLDSDYYKPVSPLDPAKSIEHSAQSVDAGAEAKNPNVKTSMISTSFRKLLNW